MFIYKITHKIHPTAIYFFLEITSVYFSACKLNDTNSKSCNFLLAAATHISWGKWSYHDTMSIIVPLVESSDLCMNFAGQNISWEEFTWVSWKFLSVQWSLSSTAWHSKIEALALILTKLTEVSRPLSDFTIRLWMLFQICAAMYKKVLFFSERIIVRLVSLAEMLMLL